MKDRSWLRSGYTMMFFATIALSLMGALTKYVAQDIASSQIVLFRGLFMTIAIFIWAKKSRVRLQGNQKFLLFSRGVIGAIALLCFYYAIAHIKLADAMALNLSSPAFVLLFASLWLKEKVTTKELSLMVGALLGALLIVQPGTALFQWASFIGLLSAFLAGIAYTLIRKLSETEDKLSIIFSFSWNSILFSIPFVWGNLTMPSPMQWLALFGVGFFALLGQYFLTAAYAVERAGPVSSITYLGVFFAGIWGFLFWTEYPTGLSLFGMSILIGSCLLLSLNRVKRSKR